MQFLQKNGSYSWRRLTLALAILAVIAFSSFLTLDDVIISALLTAFGTAVTFFFVQHSDTPPPPPPNVS